MNGKVEKRMKPLLWGFQGLGPEAKKILEKKATHPPLSFSLTFLSHFQKKNCAETELRTFFLGPEKFQGPFFHVLFFGNTEGDKISSFFTLPHRLFFTPS